MKHINNFFALLFSGRLVEPAKFKEELHSQRVTDFGDDTSTERFFQTLEDTAHFSAPQRLKVGKSFFTTEGFLRRQDFADWQQVDDDIQLFTARFIEAARRKGIPLYAHSAFRTKAEQLALFKKKRSNLTWPFASHCQGKAVDIVHGRYHWELSPQEWALLGKMGKHIAHKLGLQLDWGGDWSFYDPAHWQISNWKDQPIKNTESVEPVRQTPRAMLNKYKGR